jgi:hypothetical protein
LLLAVLVLVSACRADEWGTIIGDAIWQRPVGEEGPAYGALVPGPDGSVVVTLSEIAEGRMAWQVHKLDDGGETLWAVSGVTQDTSTGYDPPAFDVTADGDTLVATWLRTNPNDEGDRASRIDLSRIAPDGAIRWTRTIATATGEGRPSHLRATPDGGCFLVSNWMEAEFVDLGGGAITDLDPRDARLLARYDRDGAHLWSGVIPFKSDLDTLDLGLAVRGDALIVGGFQDLIAMAAAPEDGALTVLWHSVLSEVAQPRMLASDGQNAYVTGHDMNFDSVLARLGAEGEEEWRAPVVGDTIGHISFTPAGEVVVVGHDSVDDNLQGYFVATFDGDTWRRQRTDSVELLVTDDSDRIYLGRPGHLSAHYLLAP